MTITKTPTIPNHSVIDPATPLPSGAYTYPGSIGPLSLTTHISNANIINAASIPKITDTLIEGKMLVASLRMPSYEAVQMDDLEMKNRLITKIVREIMDNNCIEFTKQQDLANDDVVIRARIFVVPDSQVRIIRQMQK